MGAAWYLLISVADFEWGAEGYIPWTQRVNAFVEGGARLAVEEPPGIWAPYGKMFGWGTWGVMTVVKGIIAPFVVALLRDESNKTLAELAISSETQSRSIDLGALWSKKRRHEVRQGSQSVEARLQLLQQSKITIVEGLAALTSAATSHKHPKMRRESSELLKDIGIDPARLQSVLASRAKARPRPTGSLGERTVRVAERKSTSPADNQPAAVSRLPQPFVCTDVEDVKYSAQLNSTQWFSVGWGSLPISGGYGQCGHEGWQDYNLTNNDQGQLAIMILDNKRVASEWPGGILTVWHDNGQQIEIRIPPFTDVNGEGFIDANGKPFNRGFYVGRDGSTYFDEQLTAWAAASSAQTQVAATDAVLHSLHSARRTPHESARKVIEKVLGQIEPDRLKAALESYAE